MFSGRSSARHIQGYGRRQLTNVSPAEESANYINDTLERTRDDAMRLGSDVRYMDEVDSSLPQPIEVDSVKFYCKENAKSHHTENYDLLEKENPSPVLRRGESFFMAIRFSKPFNMDKDKIRIELSFGPKKMVSKGTLVILPVTLTKKFTLEGSSWDICMSGYDKTMLNLQIQIPYVAGVGIWRMKIHSRVAGKKKTKVYNCKEIIYVLFNPWCKDDPVYMQDDISRQEYVLSDVGKIFVGDHHAPHGRPWVYGQFAYVSLPASVFLLEKSGLDYTARGNPVKVVRAISAMVNSKDDNGVLVGNWSGHYEEGIAPWIWTGSTAILEQYMTNGGEPVKYGQCWVFSGVYTTVCRALGIPCRSITNFLSAHDTDESLTVDTYLDSEGYALENVTKDKIWNFHVWNDCWMSRSDLPFGYGGWQAADATPQETSEGVYRVGPASLVAVRRGETSHQYDASFVFAEVNADVVHWQKDDSIQGYKKFEVDTHRVGRLIVTKRAGFDDDERDTDMEDITLLYKSKEGTSEERMTVLNAARRTNFSNYFDIPAMEDVKFKLKDIDRIMIGKNFKVIVEVENKSDENRTVTSVVSTSTIHYTGIIARKVKRANETFLLKPRQKEELTIEVTVDEYLDKLVEYAMLKIYAISTVKETKQTWAEEDDFQIDKPPLKIEIEGHPKVYTPLNVSLTFTNPLKRALEDCVLTLEGPGLAEPYGTTLDDVGPEQTMIHIKTVVPKKAGPRKITAVFSSRQLIEVTGSKQIVVED